MDSPENGKCISQSQEEHGAKTPKSCSTTDQFSTLLDPTREASNSVPSIHYRPAKGFHIPFIREMNYDLVWAKTWIKNPINMALFIWYLCVFISGNILFMVSTGMLNSVLPKKSQQDTWFEVSNQTLNAMFTLMCLYQHPNLFHHLALLFRWKEQDVLSLRTTYCKEGLQKPNERMHISVVVVLLHLNCLAQYTLCAINLGYSRPKRPAAGITLGIVVALSAAVIASLYRILSPLGREYASETDQESQSSGFMLKEDLIIVETTPQWIGGLFDFCDNACLAYLSLFCSCCLFGWNMDRLGFGNMYVHTITFLMFCIAPFFIFYLAAINVDNEVVREAFSIIGFVLSVFGLLYGGFWRIKMRKSNNLPSHDLCCGEPDITDCVQWLCCCPCSLAQEVRTADYYYGAIQGKFYSEKNMDDAQPILNPLLCKDGALLFKSSNSSPSIFRMEESKHKLTTVLLS